MKNDRTPRTARKANGRIWATVAFLLGVAVSVAANVAHTHYPSEAVLQAAGVTADQWEPKVGAQLVAAFFPLALLLTVEILARVPWPAGRWWAIARYVGAGVVAGVAAAVSYGHLRGLLIAYGEDEFTATVGPLAVDGLMVVASLALLAIGRHRAAPGQVPVLAPVQVPVAEEPVDVPTVAAVRTVPLGLEPDNDPVLDVPVTSDVPDPARVRAAQVFASELQSGEIPSIRRIKAALRCGQNKAQEVRAYLSVLASQ